MTQTTSGIEPVFMPVYMRRRKVNPNDTNVHVDFMDETGDCFEEYVVYHPKFLTWMKAQGLDTEKRYTQDEINELVARSPYHKATANDVDWLMKVRMQGAIQKWVDHSISVTVNLPNSVDEDLVNRLYVGRVAARVARFIATDRVQAYWSARRRLIRRRKRRRKKQLLLVCTKCPLLPSDVLKSWSVMWYASKIIRRSGWLLLDS